MSLLGTQQEGRHQLVHREAANEATKNIAQDAQLKIVRQTGSRNDKKQHAIGCENIHTVANGRQFTVSHTAGLHTEIRDQWMAARNGKPSSSTKAFVPIVRKIKPHDVVSSGIFADEYQYNHPHEWTKEANTTLVEATEAYMVEVITESHC